MKKLLSGATLLAAAVVMLTPSAAQAATASVTATAAPNMPYVTSTDSYVRKIAQCANTMYAVGAFSTVGAAGKPTLTRHNVFSFDATTGAISSWDPNTNGIVDSIAFSADCASAYLGGAFSTVHGVAVKNLAKVSTATGVPDAAFHPAPNGEVFTVQQAGGRLYVGGSYSSIAGVSRAALATVNLTTGAIDNYSTIAISGTLPNSGRKVYNFKLSNDGTKLLASGSFLTVAGQTRRQVFVLDLGGASVTLDPWYSDYFTPMCASSEPLYTKGIGWSPDGQSIYIATTGYKGASVLCDATVKFPFTANSHTVPLWINKTGCDSLYAVAADDTNVYVGGHQRWLGNPNGCDAAGPGAFSRPGIGSLSASNGAVLPWNPTRSRGRGADDLLLTPAGLWVASDTYLGATKCNNSYHPGICFFPR
jgi:hypothetical protein